MNYSTEELQKHFRVLPHELQEEVMALGKSGVLAAIGQKHGLSPEQTSALVDETALVILGLTKAREYVGELVKRFDMPRGVVRAIALDVNNQVFKEVRTRLRRAHEEGRFGEAEAKRISAVPTEKVHATSPDVAPAPRVSAPAPQNTPVKQAPPASPAPSPAQSVSSSVVPTPVPDSTASVPPQAPFAPPVPQAPAPPLVPPVPTTPTPPPPVSPPVPKKEMPLEQLVETPAIPTADPRRIADVEKTMMREEMRATRRREAIERYEDPEIQDIYERYAVPDLPDTPESLPEEVVVSASTSPETQPAPLSHEDDLGPQQDAVVKAEPPKTPAPAKAPDVSSKPTAQNIDVSADIKTSPVPSTPAQSEVIKKKPTDSGDVYAPDSIAHENEKRLKESGIPEGGYKTDPYREPVE